MKLIRNALVIVITSFVVLSGLGVGMWKTGLWEKAQSLTDQLVPTTSYTIEAKGWNLRAYAWTDPVHGLECIAVVGTDKGGVSCVRPVSDASEIQK
tara:strand:+ start:5348 stop:5635 length:288 start_codon:yes stop_codon:yes gene_type:complete